MTDAYQVRVARLSDGLEGILPRWRALHRRTGLGRLHRDPAWLMERYREGEGAVKSREDLLVFFLEQEGEFVGASPFVVVHWPLPCGIGEVSLARLPLRRACLPQCDLNVPDAPGAYDALFRALAREDQLFDTVYLEDLEVDAPLWRYLHDSTLVRRHFNIFQPEEATRHAVIRVPPTFEEYLGKFSSKTRATLRRKRRRLEKVGRLEVTRVEDVDRVPSFVDAAAEVSRKSYQYALLGLGIRDPASEKRRLAFLAGHGWLRSYVLTVDGVPCAYLIGVQDERSFWYWDVAQDPDWNRHSVGTVLLFSVLEDLFAHRRPEIVDFSTGEGEHKLFFANDHYVGADLYLTPRRPYPRTALRAHTASRWLSRRLAAWLERHDLKQRFKKAIRGASMGRKGTG